MPDLDSSDAKSIACAAVSCGKSFDAAVAEEVSRMATKHYGIESDLRDLESDSAPGRRAVR
jgi:hypothetical protein